MLFYCQKLAYLSSSFATKKKSFITLIHKMSLSQDADDHYDSFVLDSTLEAVVEGKARILKVRKGGTCRLQGFPFFSPRVWVFNDHTLPPLFARSSWILFTWYDKSTSYHEDLHHMNQWPSIMYIQIKETFCERCNQIHFLFWKVIWNSLGTCSLNGTEPEVTRHSFHSTLKPKFCQNK